MSKQKKKESNEDLENLLRGKTYLEQIENDYEELEKLERVVGTVKNTKVKPTKVVDTIIKTETRMKMIKIRIDSRFKLLNKLLPDKRATILTDPKGNSLITAFAEAVASANEK